ncbi:winged helix-turn-helix domain-containing protein [Halobacterium sp. CBA1126]|uniref:PadR family transcriptional regulator n=1 Tax=Halobacterium sp. CBA1126 TaxID=2668074 RepID=UPI002F91B5DB
MVGPTFPVYPQFKTQNYYLFGFADRSGIPVLSLSVPPVREVEQMALISETKLDILQHLSEEPSHGYALAEKLDLSHGYIYTHLGELGEEGMIEVVEERDGKKIYELTESGEYLLKAFSEQS